MNDHYKEINDHYEEMNDHKWECLKLLISKIDLVNWSSQNYRKFLSEDSWAVLNYIALSPSLDIDIYIYICDSFWGNEILLVSSWLQLFYLIYCPPII
jgi:hypothetical protein